MDADDLIALGFTPLGNWGLGKAEGAIALVPEGSDPAYRHPLLASASALYAFVQGSEVLYIGKTARTLRARLAGYCLPPGGQATNFRCNAKVREQLSLGREVEVLGFKPFSDLSYGGFPVDMAAGLEDSLIRAFTPSWNMRRAGAPITETAEREAEALDDSQSRVAATTMSTPAEADKRFETPPEEHPEAGTALACFPILLGETYLQKGWINPPARFARLLGEVGEPMSIYFGDAPNPVTTQIYRAPTKPTAVRLMRGMDAVAAWFTRNFREGDTVQAEILGRNAIRLIPPAA